MDLFNQKILPMLLQNDGVPFDDKNYIFELKLDGIRCLFFCDENQTIIQSRKLKIITESYPELNQINKQCKSKCILDGEIVYIDESGYPDFNTLQKRIMTSGKANILYLSKHYPVSFVAFDILYFKNKDITKLPLMKRKEILKDCIVENEFISIARYIEEKGTTFFESIKKLELEGIVAKRKDSFYKIGIRSDNWIKIKNIMHEDFYICGYTLDEDKKIRNLILSSINNEKLKYDCTIYCGNKKLEIKKILDFAKTNTIKTSIFKNFDDDIIWLRPKLICTVEFLCKTKEGNLRQPVFRGIRTD